MPALGALGVARLHPVGRPILASPSLLDATLSYHGHEPTASQASSLGVPSRQMPGIPAALQPHSGHVFLDMCQHSRKWFLTHKITGELVMIGEFAQAGLVYDTEGFGALHRSGEGEVDLDSLLHIGLYRTGEGAYFVQLGGPGSQEPIVPLHNMWVDSKQAVLSLPLVSACATIDWAIVVFSHPENGVAVCWSLRCMHRALKLTSFQGQSWTLIKKGFPRWQSGLAEWMCHDGLMHAKASGDEEAGDGRTLRFPSASTVAMLMLLARFAYGNARQGGFREEAAKLASVTLLRSFLGELVKAKGGIVVPLFLHSEVTIDMPRPIIGQWHCALPVGIDLMCNFEEMKECVHNHIDTALPDVAYMVDVELRQPADLVGFLSKLIPNKDRWYLASQLLTQVGLQLDALVVDMFKGRYRAPAGAMTTKKIDDEESVLHNPAYMGSFLSSYVAASRKNAKGAQCVSVATDKGRIHGFNLMLTAMVLPDNTSSWLPPQASVVYEGSLPAAPETPRLGLRKPTPRLGFRTPFFLVPVSAARVFLVPVTLGGSKSVQMRVCRIGPRVVLCYP